jgi:dienelactone hydrolase
MRPAVKTVMDASIPSPATQGGIAVAVLVPEKPRYEDGAPVVVRVVPAMSPNPVSRRDVLGLTGLGFVVVEMAYPGGDDFDQGGPKCKRAVADVFKFAMGRKTDARRNTIAQISPVPVLRRIVGAIGMSHGGNSIVTTLEDYPDELRNLAFYVSYESPAGTSKDALGDSVLVDYGGVLHDPNPREDADGNGLPWDDGRNPYYRPGKGLDFSKLKWDPTAFFKAPMMQAEATGVLFLDGNGNGKYDTIPPPESKPEVPEGRALGFLPTDTNRNGRADRDEDFPFRFHRGRFGERFKKVYSVSVTRAAATSVFQKAFPPDIATVDEAREYWSQRDMTAGFERLSPALADLLVCIYAGRQDHVQAATDYPHIRAQYDGLRRAGIKWVRLNPDPEYVRAVVDMGRLQLPNNATNEELTAETIWEKTEPVRGALGHVFVAIAACELADRIKANDRRPHLEDVLFPDAPMVSVAAPPPLLAPQKLNPSGEKSNR